MDEIGQGPRWELRLPPGRWLAVAAAGALIAAAVTLAVTFGGARHRPVPGVSASARGVASQPLGARVVAQIQLPVSQTSQVAVLGSTAWVSDWYTGKVVGVDLATRRVTHVLRVGGVQDGPVSMATGAGSVWVLDFSTDQVLRINPATGAITHQIQVRGEATDVAYGDGYLWVISDGPFNEKAEEHLYKISPARDAIVQIAPIPGAGPGCMAAPGPQGVWTGCGGVPGITLIDPASLKVVKTLPIAPGDISQIIPGQQTMWLFTAMGLVRVNPATGKVTGTVQTVYDPGAGSAPAVAVDDRGRVWAVGPSMLEVLIPGSLAMHPVAHTAGAVSVVTERSNLWTDTGTTLLQLDVHTAS